jgi:hypothetical protein
MLAATLWLAMQAVPFVAFWRDWWHCPCPKHETYWRMWHLQKSMVDYRRQRGGRCPPSLASLDYRSKMDAPMDGFQQPLIFVCPGVRRPDGADFTSAGIDQIFGTDDDLRSR